MYISEVLAFVGILTCWTFVHAASDGSSVRLVGINLPSLEFSIDTTGSGYFQKLIPSYNEMRDWRNAGFNFVRFGFAWQFLQPTLGGNFDATYSNLLFSSIANLTRLGFAVNIDCHNYARLNDKIIGQAGGPSAAQFADLWTRIATRVQTNNMVMFGLMNEPYDLGYFGYRNFVTGPLQAAINGIRSTQSTQTILLPGDQYEGVGGWATASLPSLQLLSDTKQNLSYSLHNYFDALGGEGYTDCFTWDDGSSTSKMRQFDQVTSALRMIKGSAYLTEFGGQATQTCLATIRSLLDYLDANSDVWIGWTAWGPELDGPPTYMNPNGTWPTIRYPSQPQQDKLYLGLDDRRPFELVHNALFSHLPIPVTISTSSTSATSSSSSSSTSSTRSSTTSSSSSSSSSSATSSFTSTSSSSTSISTSHGSSSISTTVLSAGSSSTVTPSMTSNSTGNGSPSAILRPATINLLMVPIIYQMIS